MSDYVTTIQDKNNVSKTIKDPNATRPTDFTAQGMKQQGNYTLPLINTSGVPQGMMSAESMALLMSDNVKIAVTRKSDAFPLMIDAATWAASYNNSSYITDGVVVCDGRSTFVIGKQETAKGWAPDSGYAFSTGNTYINGTTNRDKAMADFDGKAEMAKIYATSGYMGEDYAPYWLSQYTTVDGYSSGWSYDNRKAGMWRLPTLGELTLIYANKKAINAAMDLIGGTRLQETWYWSCTEWSEIHAWFLYLIDGTVYYNNKYIGTRVRPVCAF